MALLSSPTDRGQWRKEEPHFSAHTRTISLVVQQWALCLARFICAQSLPRLLADHPVQPP